MRRIGNCIKLRAVILMSPMRDFNTFFFTRTLRQLLFFLNLSLTSLSPKKRVRKRVEERLPFICFYRSESWHISGIVAVSDCVLFFKWRCHTFLPHYCTASCQRQKHVRHINDILRICAIIFMYWNHNKALVTIVNQCIQIQM